MDRHRKHDVILISDSNVRVRPSYLRETACYLAEPGVGLVSNLFAGVGEVARRGGHGEPPAQRLHRRRRGRRRPCCRVTCVVGKSMLMPVAALEAIGGFAAVRNVLAEDQVIGVRVRQAGYSIRLSHHVIENVNCQPQLPVVLEPALALVQDPPPDGAAGVPGRAGRPTWRPSAWSGRSRASRGSPGAGCCSWSAWAWCATPSRPDGCAARSPSCGTCCTARSRTSCCCRSGSTRS